MSNDFLEFIRTISMSVIFICNKVMLKDIPNHMGYI